MAVYRSDQAQITFAAEAAQGGDMERLAGASHASSNSTLSVDASAGDSSITVASATTYRVGDFIRLGTTGQATNSEMRRVEFINGAVLHLDRPLAFAHSATGSNNNTVMSVDGTVSAVPTVGRKYITFLPGVYETVDVPDLETAIEPRYFLGTQSRRNFYQAFKGQQTFTGAIADMVLLNGWPLRFPIGSVVTVPSATTGSAVAVSATASKGDVFFTQDLTSILSVGDFISVGFVSSPDSSTPMEVRRVATISSSACELDYPLMFDHPGPFSVKKVDTSGYYTHYLIEEVDLDTISMHVHMRDSGETVANDFDRRYVGGMVGSMTLTAEEGGLLTCGWDGIPFMDMVHNQLKHTGYSGSYGSAQYTSSDASDIPRFALMQKITVDDVNKLPGHASNVTIDTVANTLDVTDINKDGTRDFGSEPYYFSRGSIKFMGQEFAKIRSFSLTVGNNEEPRYYVAQRFGRHRGPNEIREQQREYTLAATVVLPDSAAATSNSLTAGTALFKELLLEGDYGTDTNPNMKGFQVSLEFIRGTNDKINIDIPGRDAGGALGTPGTPSTPAEGGNNQGVFIRTAPHTISGDNPLQVELDMLVRNLNIAITDSIPVYP